MAVNFAGKSGRRTALALAAATLALPGLASAQVWGGRGTESSDQGERLGGERPGRADRPERGDRGGWQQRGDAGQQQAQQQRPQRSWTPPVAQPAPVAAPAPAPAPVQGARSWGRSDTNQGGGRNWTDADNRNRDQGRDAGRDRANDRDHDRNRDWNRDRRTSDSYDRDDRRDYNRGYDRDYRRTDNHWDRQWRSNSRYNWQSYRRGHPDTYRLGSYYAPYRGYSYRRLSIGFYLDGLFFSNRYWIADPWQYRLPEVYGPYRWVRYYDDALLVNIYSGEVVDVIYSVFW